MPPSLLILAWFPGPPAPLGNVDRPMAGRIRSQTISVIRAVQNSRRSSSSRPEDAIYGRAEPSKSHGQRGTRK
jgi:hypothetical protein